MEAEKAEAKEQDELWKQDEIESARLWATEVKMLNRYNFNEMGFDHANSKAEKISEHCPAKRLLCVAVMRKIGGHEGCTKGYVYYIEDEHGNMICVEPSELKWRKITCPVKDGFAKVSVLSVVTSQRNIRIMEGAQDMHGGPQKGNFVKGGLGSRSKAAHKGAKRRIAPNQQYDHRPETTAQPFRHRESTEPVKVESR